MWTLYIWKRIFFPATKYEIFVIKMRLMQKKNVNPISVCRIFQETDIWLIAFSLYNHVEVYSTRNVWKIHYFSSNWCVCTNWAVNFSTYLKQKLQTEWFSLLLFEIQFRRIFFFFFFSFAQFIHFRVEASTGTMKIGEQKSLTVLWINRYIAGTGICNIVVGATMEHVATETRYKSKIMTGTLYNRQVLWSFLYFASWLMSSVIVVSVCFCCSLVVVSITNTLYFHLVNIKTRWILKSGLGYLQSRPSAQHWVPFMYCKLVISMIAEDWNKDQYDTKRSSILFC